MRFLRAGQEAVPTVHSERGQAHQRSVPAHTILNRVAWLIPHCAHRTSTLLRCARSASKGINHGTLLLVLIQTGRIISTSADFSILPTVP